MYIVASFRQDKNLERAIAELEHIGIENKSILALPLEPRAEQSVYESNKANLFELGPIIGTVSMLFGAIYGFILDWGPILWGLIGLGVGVTIGFSIDLLRLRKKIATENRNAAEVFVLIHCNEDQAEKAKEILWRRFPLGLSTFNNEKVT